VTAPGDAAPTGRLQRSVGFWGLMFVSLGSIIGSSWMIGAFSAAKLAGPASILAWIIAAAMLALLALVYAELGSTYPVAGGAARYPYYSHGPIAGFSSGWASWLQAVFIAPIEVIAVITYVDSVGWIHENIPLLGEAQLLGETPLLNGTGVVLAVILMAVFTAINLAGAKFMSESNSFVVILKVLVPLFAALAIAYLRFAPDNFSAGDGFMPHGFHGVFAALTTGGVVFGLQGFEQAGHLAGEARDPKKHLARAIIVAMAIGALLYTVLQVVLIGALDPSRMEHDWYALAGAVGAAVVAKLVLAGAIISPAGTGIVYVATSARLSYALGEEREMPSALARTNKRGVPVVSIVVAAVVGTVAFGPFKSWNELVNVVTSATAIMYAFAPVSLAALHKLDPDRPRPYRVPSPRLVLPAAFCAANLIIYWGNFATTWKLACAMEIGLVLFAIGAWRRKTGAEQSIRNALWIAPWLIGHVQIGALGRFGGAELLPEWVDIGLVIAFALLIYSLALRSMLTREASAAAVAKDAHQIDYA
jgi:amino acid transporter